MIKADCDLGVQIEGRGEYRPGDLIRGTITVHASDDVKCKGLTAELTWRTHGKGNVASESVRSENLFVGQWRRGSHEYPFEFRAPDGPFTYRGDLLNVDWFIETRADVPWALDPKARLPIRIDAADDRLVEVHGQDEVHASKGILMGIGVVVYIGLCLFALNVIRMAFTDDWTDGLFALAFSAVILGVLLFVLKSLVTKAAFRRLELLIHHPATRDEGYRLDVGWNSRKRVRSVRTTVVIEEVVVEGHGTDQTTHRSRTHTHTCAPREVIDLKRREFDLNLPDPDEYGWSFEASDNELKWFLEVEIDVDKWPDHTERIDLTVSAG